MHTDQRIPTSCPFGFQGRYTVVPGDTMFLIAQRFGVSLDALIEANPHITNPDLIFPGDVLCVPAGRVPVACRPGFTGRTIVIAGDTMFEIAQFFRTRLEALIANNPHITNPNLIFPGDVLCVPGFVPFPCCVVLGPVGNVPRGTGGAAFVNVDFTGGEAVSFVARLPEPSTFGNFDTFVAEVIIPGIEPFREELFATPEEPPTWDVTISLPTAAALTPDTEVRVRAANSATERLGPVVIESTLGVCQGTPFTGCNSIC